MAIQASIIKEYEDNFLVDEAKLRKVASIMADYAGKLEAKSHVEFYVEREDQTAYETKDIEEVLADENTPGKRIVTVSINIELTEAEKEQADLKNKVQKKAKAFIGFTKRKSPRVRIGLSHTNRDWCFLLSEELDSQIKRLLRKRPLKFIPLSIIDGVVFFSVTAVLIAWLFLWIKSKPPTFTVEQINQMSQDQKLNEILRIVSRGPNAHDLGYVVGSGYSLILVFFIFYKPLARTIRYLTESTFYWGDAVSHFERRERLASNIKWVVIIGFIISVISGLATTGLLNFWTKH